MLSQDQATEAWGQINDFITNRNGDIFQEQPWGTRRLAYPIHRGAHHFLEGNYRLIRFSTETPFNQALENFLKFDERVLRSLVLSIPNREILPDPAAARPAPVAATAPRPGGEGEAAPVAADGATAAETPEVAAEAASTEASPAAETVTESEAVAPDSGATSEATEANGTADEASVAEATAEAEPVATVEESPAAETGIPPEAEAATEAESTEETGQAQA